MIHEFRPRFLRSQDDIPGRGKGRPRRRKDKDQQASPQPLSDAERQKLEQDALRLIERINSNDPHLTQAIDDLNEVNSKLVAGGGRRIRSAADVTPPRQRPMGPAAAAAQALDEFNRAQQGLRPGNQPDNQEPPEAGGVGARIPRDPHAPQSPRSAEEKVPTGEDDK